MSVYNGERYLREAVEGILNQSYSNLEFIIINDGSTDRTREIIESYQDERIVLINQDNAGLTASLNRAIGRAGGAFIARQDADDCSLPGRISTEVEFLLSHQDIALVGSAVQVISSRSEVLATFRHPTAPAEIHKTLRSYNCFWHGSVMFRRECFEAVGGYSEEFNMAEDYELWLRFRERYRMANLAEPLYAYRFTTESITVKKMTSMHRLADLARRHAVAREDGDHDQILPQNIRAYLATPLTADERRAMIGNYKPWCRLLLSHDLIDDAMRLMSALFRYHPNPFFRLAFLIGRRLNPQSNLARFIEYA